MAGFSMRPCGDFRTAYSREVTLFPTVTSLRFLLVGAAVLVVLPQVLTVFHEYEQALLGLILMVFMIFLRRGIVPSLAAMLAGWRK